MYQLSIGSTKLGDLGCPWTA